MGLTYVTVAVKAPGRRRNYEANFLVDAGATDSLVPAAELRKIGVRPAGKMACELADGSLQEYPFGLVEIAFMAEITAGRIVMGPNDAEPIRCKVHGESLPARRFQAVDPAAPMGREIRRRATASTRVVVLATKPISAGGRSEGGQPHRRRVTLL